MNRQILRAALAAGLPRAADATGTEPLRLDVTDEQATSLVASVRILRAEEGNEVSQIGYLRIHGRAVHPIQCEGP